MPKLTKRVIDAIEPDPSGKELFVWDSGDGALKGFGVRVMPGGTASYLVQYRNAYGQTRRLAIGRVGVLTPEEARGLAEDKLRDATKGGDPSVERHAIRKSLTVAELADLYQAEGPAEKPNKKASSWNTDRSNITRHIVPLLGRKMAKSLTQADIARFQADVAAGKSAADIKTKKQGRAIVAGGKGTAARSLAVLGAMLQFGAGRGILPANPAKGVKLYKGEQKERFLSAAEVARLSDTLTVMEVEGLNKNAAAAVRLLLLTGCRKDEILSLKWENVDIGNKCLRLPDSKTGAKVVPVAAAALQLLASLPRDDKTIWVLPASRTEKAKPGEKGEAEPDAGHYTGLQKAWERIRERASLPGLRLHDLRHSFASFAIADGATLFMVGKVLGHKQTRTTEIYAHLADDPVRAVADRAANRIGEAMKAKADKADDAEGKALSAEIINLPKRTA
jgi:integrase